nr:hypothetical protein [Bacteroidales bacterium]
SLGHNVFGSTSGYTPYSADADDMDGKSKSDVSGEYDTTLNSYVWNGSISGFTSATSTDVTEAMTNNFSISACGITDLGNTFYTWLDNMTPKGYLVDGRNAQRTGSWWPGSYNN